MGTYWWKDRPEERFWLESTDRADIGADLRAPLADDAGRDNWRYTLFRSARPGDVVFHYDKRKAAVVAASRVSGPSVPAPIVWAARGSYARERGAKPTELPGYKVPLEDYTELGATLPLAVLRAAKSDLEALVAALPPGAKYFPFELSDRPVRPLQGYAFKLPAAFVQAFPALQLSSLAHKGLTATANSDAGAELDRFRTLLSAIEAAAAPFAIGRLQERRAHFRGLKRTSKRIFRDPPPAADWTFHRGGREELQFNVGLDTLADQRRSFRAGVAFSLEPSRSLPDVSVLEPKIARFNAWMREHPDAFAELSMWWWQGSNRSPDLPPGPISPALARAGVFIFLGRHTALDSADALEALRTLDALMPLWEWVEAGPSFQAPLANRGGLDTLRLEAGREIDGGRWIRASSPERSLDIYLRHAEIQRRLKLQLLAEGCDEVILEPPIGRRAIDLVARHGTALWFYEVKTGPDDRACLREALGQLLEYALWPGATKPDRLIVVGEPPLSNLGAEYLDRLNASFPVPIAYRQLTLMSMKA
ncbi:hypothetical protein ACIQC9_02985 [Brevundimonas sp. NPDC092305]|uniref:hypothetical protein n=1 Tax=Brevundimonas sp. NPDC092305 TaxID=3363957 RepID=UPI0038255A52